MSRQTPFKGIIPLEFMTREEIEKRMDELAHKYVEKRDPEIIEELYRLRIELGRLEKESAD
jgi:retron-type reverse transcriptase